MPSDGFELKKAVNDLFDELVSLDNGTVVRLEFKHGVPLLLETASAAIGDSPNAPTPAQPSSAWRAINSVGSGICTSAS